MEKTEQATCDISKAQLKEKDLDFCKENGISPESDVRAECELLDVMAAQDLYKDATTYKQVLVEGVSGVKPTADSTVEFLMKFLIKGKVFFSNFKLKESLVSKELSDFLHITDELDEITTSDSVFKATLNDFTLPPAIHRTLKTMNMNGLSKIESNSSNKLLPYLPSEMFKQDYVSPKDHVVIFLLLKDFDTVALSPKL